MHDERHGPGHVEAALLPLRAHLTVEQLELVRSVLCSSIETDPVARLLLQSATGTRGASVKLAHDPNPLGRSADGTPLARSREMKY